MSIGVLRRWKARSDTFHGVAHHKCGLFGIVRGRVIFYPTVMNLYDIISVAAVDHKGLTDFNSCRCVQALVQIAL